MPTATFEPVERIALGSAITLVVDATSAIAAGVATLAVDGDMPSMVAVRLLRDVAMTLDGICWAVAQQIHYVAAEDDLAEDDWADYDWADYDWVE